MQPNLIVGYLNCLPPSAAAIVPTEKVPLVGPCLRNFDPDSKHIRSNVSKASLTTGGLDDETIGRTGSISKVVMAYAGIAKGGIQVFSHRVTRYFPELAENSPAILSRASARKHACEALLSPCADNYKKVYCSNDSFAITNLFASLASATLQGDAKDFVIMTRETQAQSIAMFKTRGVGEEEEEEEEEEQRLSLHTSHAGLTIPGINALSRRRTIVDGMAPGVYDFGHSPVVLELEARRHT
ncbi:hypothetical protein Cob_v012652 [Colletotrichum orbiculare MAFF 240422]|uniref:Uncharacterized protein n=1 Tax=Colletotrichum orbiculare (strain 104-T / ATCC 96160 / CBS 514.97 / LARS 414 / MAFF 240422) TaxID=1213857 RepID=A0A484F977_COLOR|nr:hypothetical protein Cob_v012652 [Colletotrichum orbiculare MAFF 240422]